MAEGRVFLVTGAGPGSLGEATAAKLRAHGRVITTRRTGSPSADFHPLDLADIDSVTAFANWVGDATDRLDVLVNNAGIHLDLRKKWRAPQLVDGHEIHWRTNYLGTAHLTRLLRPLLLRTAKTHGEARVVNVVSQLHERGRNEWLVRPGDAVQLLGGLRHLQAGPGARGGRDRAQVRQPRACTATRCTRARCSPSVADRGLETAPVLARLRKLAAPLERRSLASPEVGAKHLGVLCDLAGRGARRLPRPLGRRPRRRRRLPMPQPALGSGTPPVSGSRSSAPPRRSRGILVRRRSSYAWTLPPPTPQKEIAR